MTLVGKPDGNRTLVRHRRGGEDNIKINLRKWDGGMDWIDLAQDMDRCLAVLNAVMKIWVS
jgi:hypothetical protein